MALQGLTDQMEWATQAGNAVAYAPHIRKAPLDGIRPKSVIYQIAKGDKTVPNPTASSILRAGNLRDLDPDGKGPLFETPIVSPLPETLNFLP